MKVDSVTIAHLSDLHLGPLPPTPLSELNLKRILGTLNWLRKRQFIHSTRIADQIMGDIIAQRADHVVVGGDLANLGLPSEIARAAGLLGGLGAARSVSVVPGNHDIYSTIGGRAIGLDGVRAWLPHMTSCELGARYAGADAFPFVRVIARGRTQVALIGLNSAVETAPFSAIGLLGHRQLRALADTLHAVGAAGLQRVVVLHHPPLPATAAPGHELRDAQALVEVISRHGAELVIHGHNHRRMINTLAGVDGPIPCVGVPSASAARPVGDQDLARAHFFTFTRGPSGRIALSLVGRGLAQTNRAVVEIERLHFGDH